MRLIAASLSCLLLLGPLSAGASPRDTPPDPDFPPAIEELAISSDGARMPGLIYIANGEGPHPTVVLLHGFPGHGIVDLYQGNIQLFPGFQRNIAYRGTGIEDHIGPGMDGCPVILK